MGVERKGSQAGRGDSPKGGVDPFNAYVGSRHAQNNARRLFGDAAALFGEGRLRGAVVAAILSIEESCKGVELTIACRKLRRISGRDLERLTNHAHKLSCSHERMIRWLEEGRRHGFYDQLAREGKAPFSSQDPVSVDDLVANERRVGALTKNLQRVKEACMYLEWDGRSWAGLGLGDDDLAALAQAVLALAEHHYGRLHASIDFALGTFIARNPRLAGIKEAMPELVPVSLDAGSVRRGQEVLLGLGGGPAGKQGGARLRRARAL